ncbi:hypothetical protein [uncultured Flavobacterium sp.]|uniref:hypothetical protein n=1 Tax=uncultured Flavobacterium sp. TaxID=165435 RepID=UPI0030EF8546
MKTQNLLLNAIRKQLNNGISIIDEVAQILNISYDASHRRVSNKSKFSIEETVLLCGHFKISMDNLFKNQQNIILEKTKSINQIKDYQTYFSEIANKIYLNPKEENTLYYSAKDIPIFYTIGGSILSKFKMYVWYNLMTENELIAFEKFNVENSLLNETSKLIEIVSQVKIIEIWNDTTINSSLQQIVYYFESGLLTYETSKYLLEEITAIIKSIEKKCDSSNSDYQLYYNELLILNNNVLFASKSSKQAFIPYNMLGYFSTKNEKVTSEIHNYFTNQIKNSKSLQSSGKKEQKMFFNKMYQKIDFFIKKIENFILN